MKLNWESALLALLVLEILLFGALNPRMLDLNMLLFSTSDFICIGIVALPLMTSAQGIFPGMMVYGLGLAVAYFGGYLFTLLFGCKNVDLS